ncbi:MAG TPA: response regulator [Verrucomicrobiae bacterium]|nr:response regulator [Verrucomicrobiae bacterium]
MMVPEHPSGPTEILVVEDSRTQADMLAMMLEQEGYAVSLAPNGAEALRRLRERHPALVVSDVMMPEMDGYELCAAIKEDPALASIPVILVTYLSETCDVLRSLEAGADNFVMKPYEKDFFLSRVRRTIEGASRVLRDATTCALEEDHGVYRVRSGRAQVLEILLSVYETALHKNQRLKATQEELNQLNNALERKVEARTAELLAEVAERRRAEEEIRSLNESLERRVAERTEELRAANEELEAFVYSVSHDLRIPITGIMGFSELLALDVDESQGEAASYLQMITASARKMNRLIDDLLNLSRISRADLHLEEVDLSSVVREIAEELRREAPERRADFRVEEGIVVRGDRRLLRVAVENLLRNAWKFTSKKLFTRIEVGREGEEGFFIRDNGAGFDPARSSEVFLPFRRLHSENDFPGTGIGLATVNRIVSRHGGRISAEGEVGVGATFRLTLGVREE